jgi:hypothetical protein
MLSDLVFRISQTVMIVKTGIGVDLDYCTAGVFEWNVRVSAYEVDTSEPRANHVRCFPGGLNDRRTKNSVCGNVIRRAVVIDYAL